MGTTKGPCGDGVVLCLTVVVNAWTYKYTKIAQN